MSSIRSSTSRFYGFFSRTRARTGNNYLLGDRRYPATCYVASWACKASTSGNWNPDRAEHVPRSWASSRRQQITRRTALGVGYLLMSRSGDRLSSRAPSKGPPGFR